MNDYLIPEENLQSAHRAVDQMVKRTRANSPVADDIWLSILDSVDGLSDELALSSVALLFAVSLQRLANQ